MDNDLTKIRREKQIARLKLVAILLVLISIPCYVYFFHPEFIDIAKSPEKLAATIEQYHHASIPIYLGLNVLQVVCSLPGQVFHLAGGYAFGVVKGFLLAVIGTTIGSTCGYFIARKVGHDAIHVLFGEKKITKLIDQLNSKKGIIILFVGYLIPGMPKDLMNYAAGLSDIKYRPFITLCMVGRIPGMLASIVIGNQVFDGQYTSAIVIAICVLAACGLCLLFRQRIIGAFEKFYERM